MDLDPEEERLLRSVALQNSRAVLLARERAERDLVQTKDTLERQTEQLYEQREWFEVTLNSIGDAVITTDTQGHVTFLNPVAETLTGWKVEEAKGQPLQSVFKIVNELSRLPVENPIAKVLREGVVVGLANHTALIGKDGTETAIEDSAAPIRDKKGSISGAVMVFHDVIEKRKAETALRRNEELLADFFENGAVGLHWVGPDGIILRANRAELELLGYSEKEYIGHHIAEFHADAPVIEDILSKLSCGKCLQNYEARLRCKDKSIKHVLITSNVLWQDGKFIHTRCFTRDITQQKRAEEALRESEQKFRAVFNQAAVGLATAGLDGRFEQLNQRMADILGYSEGELKKLTFLQLTHPLDLPKTHSAVAKLKSGEASEYSLEKRFIRKDGSILWGLTTVALLRDAGGKPEKFIGVIEDITDRKKAEEAKFLLAAVVESSEDAIISKTLDGTITTWNLGAERMYGYTAQEAIGKPVTILIPPHLSNEEPTIVARLKKGEKIEHYETVRVRKDGTHLDVALTVSPIKNAEGEIIGASKIARDITQQKQAAAELRWAKDQLELRVKERTASLEETTKQLETFCYTIAHDLRSPLRAQQSYAQLLLDDYNDRLDPHGRQYAERIIKSAQRLDQLVNDLLTYSRITRDQLKFTPVDLNLVVQAIQGHLEDEIKRCRAILSISPLHIVFGYEPTLDIVITNLITNALKFVAPDVHPHVRIWSESKGPLVRLWVEDNGIGISPDHQLKIFGVFQRLHKIDEYPGTGIGLAIVQKGVERMGGTVGVESQPGKGSRFWIDFLKPPFDFRTDTGSHPETLST
ncbi:MAG: putative Histidine kinase [Verrucomicrobiales bacterium]|nr:putative Histidine kinase [Verrucomicrobiales bacterium]